MDIEEARRRLAANPPHGDPTAEPGETLDEKAARLDADNARLCADVAELEAATSRKKVPWVLPRHRRAFTRGASSQAIEAHLHARRGDRRQLDRHIEWLEGLLADRLEQVAAGTWPTPTTVPLGRDVSDGGPDA
jgi:hypothetical protein